MCVISFCYNKLKSLNIKKFNPIFPSPKIRKRQNIALTPTVCPHQKERGEKSVFVGFFLFFAFMCQQMAYILNCSESVKPSRLRALSQL